jgi:drug/metabolite transporter (DMT)-like permease
LLDFSRFSGSPPQPGLAAVVALALAFAFAIGTLTSPRLQRLVLKPGRSVNEIRPFLRLLTFICGIMFVIFSIVLAFGGFNQRA